MAVGFWGGACTAGLQKARRGPAPSLARRGGTTGQKLMPVDQDKTYFPRIQVVEIISSSIESNDVTISRLITTSLGLFANTLIDFSRAERCPRPINLAGGALPIRTPQKKVYI
jgi:hypothetical protein